MAYINKDHEGRRVIVPVVENAFGDWSTNSFKGANKFYLNEYTPPIALYLKPEAGSNAIDKNIYNFPFLFEPDGLPWVEANSYLLSLLTNKHCNTRPTDIVRAKASKLLNYKIFCEKEGLDWLNFSGKRPSNRPTFKYFNYLHQSANLRPAVINQVTGVIYDFYSFVSKQWHQIDMDRVDTIKAVKFYIQTPRGGIAIDAVKRTQTLRTPPSSPPEIGYIRDQGEDLRPLKNGELRELLEVISADGWSQLERLILKTALYTGARKQTVLTMRVKHLDQFSESLLRQDGTYRLDAGPGTGIDTKFGRHQDLYVPKPLADELKVFAQSDIFKKRRNKLKEKMAFEFPDMPPLSDRETYLFLSNQGNCYYMASSDPRYPYVRSRPTGQISETIKNKLQQHVSIEFPKCFSYHWLRATYAYQRYQNLETLVDQGVLTRGDQISWIQARLHHRNRETSENYLKLFRMIDDRMDAQELYENKLSSYSSFEINLNGESEEVRSAK